MNSFQSCIGKFLNSITRDEEVVLVFMRELWPQIVGEELAAKCSPSRLKSNWLVLEVSSEVWKRELANLDRTLVRTINDYWKVRLVDGIDVQIHPKRG